MTKIKTSELAGAALDWAVTLIEKPEACEYGVEDWIGQRRHTVKNSEYVYRWHQSWMQSGPIVERRRIDVMWCGDRWCAYTMTAGGEQIVTDGDTPLIATMRGVVAAELGDEVEVPDELV